MFEFTCPLRWSDLDAQGHVNNAVVMDYLQEARVAFLKGGPAAALLRDGIVVVRHQAEYLRPVEYAESVRIRLAVTGLGAARIELGYEILQDEVLTCRARSLLVPFDFRGQHPARLRPGHRAFLESHRDSMGQMREVAPVALHGQGTQVNISVRWTDLDSYGHVNNATVFDLLQQARIVASTGWDPGMTRAGAAGNRYRWLVVRQDVDYLRQIEHRGEPYTVNIAPVLLGSSSIRIATEILDGVDVATRAITVLVCTAPDGQAIALPQGIRQRLEGLIPHRSG